jgi:periplasmic divalent cation tolerance protein
MTIDAIQVVTTTASEAEAQQIAAALVEARLAACAQVSGPITSTYRWQGKVETSHEWRCTIKTRQSHFAAVAAMITQLHSYEVPEILATAVVAGSPEYLTWLSGELADPSQP